MKKDADMEQCRVMMERMLETKYQTSISEKIKYFFLNSLFIIVSIFLFCILIENPLSLVILCGTALLMWMWGNR